MTRRSLWLLGSLGLCFFTHSSSGDQTSGEPLRQGPRPASPAEYGVGHLVADLPLADIQGKMRKLSDFRGKRAVVIAFTCKSCPLCRKFGPTLARLEKAYEKQDVAFVYVNATASETDAEIAESIQTFGFSGPYVRDRGGALARILHATHSTDVVVLDSRRTVIYRGAVDDQYGFGYSLNAPRREYLVEALAAVIDGKRPAVRATVAPGCPLDIDAKAEKKSAPAITFHNRISRVLQHHCVSCHREGGVAPFALDNFEDVAAHAAAITAVVDRGVMPPWFAAPSAADEKSPWSNDPSLSEQDKTDLLGWLGSEKPAGDPADAPLPLSFPKDWQIGKPDLIVQLPEPVPIKATGTMPYHEVIVPTGLASDKWVQALEIQSTAPQAVHHVLVFVLPPLRSGEKNRDDEVYVDQTEANLSRGFFAASVPGNGTIVLPDDYGKYLPAGARLKFQFHFTPTGTATSDQTRLGMVFCKQKPQNVIQVKGAGSLKLSIPPGAENHMETGFLRVVSDWRVTAFLPHMHLRGKAFRYEAQYPDGRLVTLLDIPRYDTNWQLAYRLAEPIDLPRGTVIRVTGWFDNSANNPANPDPTKTVIAGTQIYDEMLLGYIEYHTAKRKPAPATGPRRPGSPVRGPPKTRP
jgi:thiol-disulfide isomerase/thioredoxin